MRKFKDMVLVALLALFAGPALADDPKLKAKREREAAAMLSLELELMKKPAKLVSYSDAVKTGIEDEKPVIAWPTNREKPICPPGAICAKGSADEVWICVPRDGKMVIAATLPANATDDEVLAAFRKFAPVKQETPNPFFIDLNMSAMVGQCPGGVCPVEMRQVQVNGANAVTIPQVMVGPGPVFRPTPVRDLFERRPLRFLFRPFQRGL